MATGIVRYDPRTPTIVRADDDDDDGACDGDCVCDVEVGPLFVIVTSTVGVVIQEGILSITSCVAPVAVLAPVVLGVPVPTVATRATVRETVPFLGNPVVCTMLIPPPTYLEGTSRFT